MSANTRLVIGIALLVLGLAMPAGIVLVADTDWPAGVKALISALLLLGVEIMAVPAIAVMGKENFDRIVNSVKGILKQLKPAGNVSRTRYLLGLVLFVGSILVGWIASYFPSWLPEEPAARLGVNLGLDLIIVASLFVLGGDFWDKLRALFVHDARAVFPVAADRKAVQS